MLVDANILLYSIDQSSPFHERAQDWIVEALNGTRRVGLPWMSLNAVLRIATNPRATTNPLAPAQAWTFIDAWLDAPASWIPEPGPAHHAILKQLTTDHDVRGPLVTDAILAALCLEYGLTMVSADSDFARFNDLEWLNPVR